MGSEMCIRDRFHTSRQFELITFGTVAGEQFKEHTVVRLAPPVEGVIAILAPNRDLLLINKTSGSMMVVDPKTKSGSVLQPNDPHPVQAAAVDSNSLYQFSAGAVTDRIERVFFELCS